MAVAEDTASPRRRRAAGSPIPTRRRRGAAPGALHARQRAPAARLRRPGRLPAVLRRPAQHRRDGAQGRPRRRPDGGALGRRQPAVRPGVRPLDAVQHASSARRSGSSASSSPRPTACSGRCSTSRCGSPGRACSTTSPDGGRSRSTSTALLWGLIGGAALGLVMFLLSAPAPAARPACRSRWSGSPASGCSPPSPSTNRRGRRSTGRSCGSASAVGAVRVRADRSLAPRAAAAAAVGASPAPASAGSSGPGAAATSARGNFGGVVLATVVPAAIFGVRFGLAAPPDAPEATAHRATLPLVDLRDPGAAVHRRRAARPADPHDLPLVPQPQRTTSPSVGTTTTTIFTNKNSVNFDNWPNIFTSRLLWIALALIGIGVLAGVLAGRRTSQTFERGPGSFLVKPVDPADPAVVEIIADWKRTPGAVGARMLLARSGLATDAADPGLNRVLATAARLSLPSTCTSQDGSTRASSSSAAIQIHRSSSTISGLVQPHDPPVPADPWAELPHVLTLAAQKNVVIKITGACTLSRERYPYDDIWDPVCHMIDAFGIDRCLWGTDWTRAINFLTSSRASTPSAPRAASPIATKPS